MLILGIVILIFKEAVLERYEAIAPAFEFAVGVMLILLGANVLYRNEGNGRFTDVTADAGVGDANWSASSVPGTGKTLPGGPREPLD